MSGTDADLSRRQPSVNRLDNRGGASTRPLRVLLISPVRGVDPLSGDVIYTEGLLAHPPPDVAFETYDDAIARGALVEITGRALLSRQDVVRIRARDKLAALAFSAVNRVRRTPVLFREQLRLFHLRRGEWDLVHAHVFSARFTNLEIPLVVSNASTLDELYRDARSWSDRHVRFAHRCDTALARIVGVNLSWGSMPQATRILPFTDPLARLLAQTNPNTPIEVIPTFLDANSYQRIPMSRRPSHVGFVAKDFKAKGGETLLKAWASVSSALPEASLTIVGSEQGSIELPPSVRWIPFVDRATLIEQLLPSFDVFAYPTNFDGLPFVLLEAMRAAVPIVTSDYGALAEVVGNAGLIAPRNDPDALAASILDLLEPTTNERYSAAAVARFNAVFAADLVTKKLRGAYEAALERREGSLNGSF